MKEIWDIAVIGGGAAGLAAALEAKRAAANLSVLLLEKKEIPAKKLSVTGNGRCNLSNIHCDEQETVLDFFARAGIAVRKEGERLYPYNEDAREVAAVLTKNVKRLGVKIRTDYEIQRVEALPSGGFHLFSCIGDEAVCARKVLIATGGKSYGTLGSSGDGYRMARSFGHTVLTPVPALTGIEVLESVSALKGIRAKAEVILRYQGQKIASEYGEVQFREDGLSGICVMNLSAKIRPHISEKKDFRKAFADYQICLNLIPDFHAADWEGFLKNHLRYQGCSTGELLCTVVKAPLAAFVLQRAGLKPEQPAAALSRQEHEKLLQCLQNLPLTVKGLKGWNEAQVTAGGVSEAEVYAETMESKLIPGLHFAGEVMEYAGPCGGYNLHYAWLTGIRAGRAMAAALQNI